MPYAAPRPFHTSADNAIITISLHFSPTDLNFVLFIHRGSLLDIITKFSHVNPPSTQAPASETSPDVVSIPWSEWGPPITRWFNTIETPLARAAAPAGLRWAFIAPPFGIIDITIYDFNPHNIYHAQEDEDLSGWLTIARKGHNFAHEEVFAEDVEMGLGCTVYVPREMYQFDGLLMDEERILGYYVRIWLSMVSRLY